MGHWVTLDDDQHVYISDGGKVLATRGAISSAAGGKERGRALAQRSKAAIGKATGRTARAIEHARAAGPSLREQAAAARAGLKPSTQKMLNQGKKTVGEMSREKRIENIHRTNALKPEQVAQFVGGKINKYPSSGIQAGKGITIPTNAAYGPKWSTYTPEEIKHAMNRATARFGTAKQWYGFLPR